MNIREELENLRDLLELTIKKDFFSKEKKYDLFSYDQREKEYLKKEINLKLKKILTIINEIDESKSKEFLEIRRDIENLKDNLTEINKNSLNKSFLTIKKILNNLEKFRISEEEINKKDFSLPDLPKEIDEEIKINFDELLTCFKNKCYRSTIILCGKILEIALHRKYFEITGKDLLEKSPDIGLGNLLAKLREHNLQLDPGLPQQIHLINQLRVFSVHKKYNVFIPSKEQAQASILYTLDILNKLF